MESIKKYVLLLLLWGYGTGTWAIVADPLDSVQWPTMYRAFLSGHPVQFDDRIQVFSPESAENSLRVPIAIRMTGIEKIEKILVLADFNPLPKVLEFFPQQALPFLAFDIKLQQASPIRVAVLSEGTWYVGGRWIDAAGGGCTLPSAGRVQGNWEEHLGQVYARFWEKTPELQRLKIRMMHPMDTGLVSGIPAFYLEQMTLTTADGTPILTLQPYEPVSENPLFTFELPKTLSFPLQLYSKDNNGNTFKAELMP
ncbi:quinoprotein dehydrogenase-associated SoxYZ-like carrier [Thioflexithrix psekupsensis]|uniref:Quinoprotein dehydrogenase-associated SoxYZ-like carrier n=1 Tax=Thioflexithrix psekupsensis TaxID=1570016 RepID=A0A251X4Q3_9GAMM|nr:quinoprotein dehydrogenase-associated SoxYZ-like carrier [Thioflexithrix psekupsensis]OUD12078.1 quinoprotein dehydrogenase-associated SoxYZ-like carrier [Thioflexithrix psekupsensis]